MDKEKNIETSKKKRSMTIPFIASMVINIILIAALATASLLYIGYRNETAETIAELSKEPIKEEQEVIPSIPTATLQAYAQEYMGSVGTEFMQRLMPDKVVYKGTGGFVFADVDNSLPKFQYNIEGLSNEDGRVAYYENDMSVGKKGIDVSKYQGEIDWKKVKADGVDYAIIRVGYRGYETGALQLDEQFESNIKGAVAAGMPIGVYFFSQAVTVEEAIEEAEMVLEAIKGYELAYPVVFDTEEAGSETARTNDVSRELMTDITIAFCERVKQEGYTPMVYANMRWLHENLDMSRLTGYDLWLAQYYKTLAFPYALEMWQYTGSGKVDGIKGNVDWNISFKDYGKSTDIPAVSE